MKTLKQNKMEKIKVELNYWDKKDYYSIDSIIKGQKIIEGNNDIEIFEKFYKENNTLRYCNGSFYKFVSKDWEDKYLNWLKSDDYKNKSFSLYYGNGIVD